MLETREEMEAEIRVLKELLRDSDYECVKLMENMTDCKTTTELFACFERFLLGFSALVAKRREWRASINDLQERMNTLPDEM